jgi:hypothetical protein
MQPMQSLRLRTARLIFLGLAALALAGLLAFAPGRAAAQGADPDVAWASADSAHFRIHYRAGQRAAAERVAAVAERIHPRVTQALQWEPRARTEIALFVESDRANGFAAPLPFSHMGLFLAPPDEGELLDNSAWFDLVLTHEYTHVVHLDKVRGAPGVLRRIFGRVLWLMPNLFQPGWLIEGVATAAEGDPAAGRGRLRGPWFEAWLRAERATGFPSLAEINADGRGLPLARPYLYGAYFVDFVNRRYGADKTAAIIERYSGNIVPRLHSAPWAATGRMMDELWREFIADLEAQVDARAAPILGQPEALGEVLVPAQFDIGSVAALPDGALLAVLDDGVAAPALVRIGRDGSRRRLMPAQRGLRLEATADGRVAVTLPELCASRYLVYDLHELQGDRLVPWSRCAHLRRGALVAGGAVALQVVGASTRLVRLAAPLAEPVILFEPTDGFELIDLAASPDGRRVSVIAKRAGDWRVLDFDLAAERPAPRLLFGHDAPLQALRHTEAGLELIAAVDGQLNVWRYRPAGGAGRSGRLERLTHAHTAVAGHAGSQRDGSLATIALAHGGYELRRLPSAGVLQVRGTGEVRESRAVGEAGTAAGGLGEARPYSPLPGLVPRGWLPVITADRGLTAYGATTFGADALDWHAYSATLQAETRERELIGLLEYSHLGRHSLAVERSLAVRSSSGNGADERTTAYERNTRTQWVSVLPWLKLERRLRLGIGASVERAEQIDALRDRRTAVRDEKLLAAFVDLDTRGTNRFAEGPNRGLRAALTAESYKPFEQTSGFDGELLRADLRGFVPLPLPGRLARSVLALRWTEVRAGGRTEPYQLGGAADMHLRLGYAIAERDIALRGYRGDEPALRGRNARVASIEWRSPIADIDRQAMVPPAGINRLSGVLFVDAGGAWSAGSGPDRWRRGVGVELLGEVGLLYALGLQLRAGVARGLDEPAATRAYLSLGRAF